MDPLSDVLRAVRLEGAYFYPVEAAGPWRVDTVAARELSPRILPGAEHLISYHIVTEGRCFGGLMGDPLTELVAGDVLLFPHGDAHVMASGPDVPTGPDVMVSAPERFPETVRLGPAPARGTSMVCGFLGCERWPFNPLLASLPRRLHMRALSDGRLANLARYVVEESRRGSTGSDGVLTRLAEVMFIEALRRYADELPPEQTGWLAGLRDPVVGRALAALHAQPAAAWALEELAQASATSRSNLARRFTALVGQPPMQYLTQWRMQLASGLLADADLKVSAVAARVGYDSEAAFSRAFRKATGRSPGAWRRARREQRSRTA